MSVKPVKAGIIGCGNISGIYFENGKKLEILEIKACGDLMMDRAQAKAKEHGVLAMTPDEILADPEIDIVLNLTIPAAHAEVAQKAVEAGKSVYSEKPLALTREQGKRLLETAKAAGCRRAAS